MVAKYLIAGAISAALAGGAVWAGADSGALGTLHSADHPHDKDSNTKPETKTRTEVKSDSPRVTRREMDSDRSAPSDSRSTVDKMMRSKPKETKPGDTNSGDTKSEDAKTTRRYETTSEDIGPSYGSGHGEEAHDETAAKPSMMIESKPDETSDSKPRRAWLDDYLKSRDSDDAKPSDDSSRKTMDRITRDTSPTRTTIETIDSDIELEPGQGKATSRLRIREGDGKTTIILRKDDMATGDDIDALMKSLRSVDSGASGETYAILLDEAKKLEIDDMRDDAYINIIDFANANDDFERAEELVDRLSTPDLRDIARQRIGIAHAKAGHLEAAFALIDELEVSELADPIRLELIRAAAHVDKGRRHR